VAPSISDLKRELAKMHGLEVEAGEMGTLRIVGCRVIPDRVHLVEVDGHLPRLVTTISGRIIGNRTAKWWYDDEEGGGEGNGKGTVNANASSLPVVLGPLPCYVDELTEGWEP